MVWVAISQSGAMAFCIVNGTVYSVKYCDILNGFLLETAHGLFPNGRSLQQDTVILLPIFKLGYKKTNW